MDEKNKQRAEKMAARIKESDRKQFAALAGTAILRKAEAMWVATGRADLADMIAAFEADLLTPQNEALTITRETAIKHLRGLRADAPEDPR